MRLILLVFVLVFFAGTRLSAQVEQDKVLHFGIGALSGAAGAYVASELTDRNRFWTVTGSIATSLLAGLAKEYMDEQNSNNSWDNADLGATVLGGITVGVTIELFSRKNGKRYQSHFRGKNTDHAQREALENYFRSERPYSAQPASQDTHE